MGNKNKDKDWFKKLTPEEKQAYIQETLNRASGVGPQHIPLVTTGFPDKIKTALVGLAGLPIETRGRSISHPFAITFFSMIMVAVHYLSVQKGLGGVLMEWGFIPTQFYRHFGATFFTSFFLHGSWMHLLGNCYYFYVFGDDVEDDLASTPLTFLKLLFVGHLWGLLAHGILTGFSSVPLVGASAGISALMGYYMIRFPKRRITYMLFFLYVWIHVPVLAAFLWKFGWEFMIASSSIGRSTGVAHWGHLGGALYGIIIALRQPKK